MENQVKLTAARQLRRQGVRLRETVATKGKQNMIIVLALVALIAVFYILNPNFLKTYNIVSMAQSLAPYAVLALGVTFVIATGGIDLSIGTVCIASSVIAGHMFEKNLVPLWAVIPLMIAIGALFGLKLPDMQSEKNTGKNGGCADRIYHCMKSKLFFLHKYPFFLLGKTASDRCSRAPLGHLPQ